MTDRNGGAIIGEVLASRGVETLFTLCGGHISPILVGAKARGIQVVDVRDEKHAVFAADAVARMTGVPGVAAVTAGPGVTNTVTAVKNAQMAQTPLVLFGGATATLLKGRGSLQDIDQLSLMQPITKWATSCKTVAALRPTVERAFDLASSGVPGPVFVEVPVDLLYPEAMVREIFLKEAGLKDAKNLGGKALELLIKGYLFRQFHQPHVELPFGNHGETTPALDMDQLSRVAELLEKAERPVLVIGSQTLVGVRDAPALARAVKKIGIPTFLGGMARGLLGRRSDIQFRHKRGGALKEADLVIVAGFPFDFRLSYGRAIGSKATVVAVNLSQAELKQNRKPEVAVQYHAGQFLELLSERVSPPGERLAGWFSTLRAREDARDAQIADQGASASAGKYVNPLHFFLRLEEKLSDDAVLVVDGGDFVATASYIVRPRAPLSWLDPGAFGTLGVGGGFTLGATLVRPKSEVWLIYGDGSSAYSLSEFDSYLRHGVAPIAVIGTDALWAQIAREQGEMLGDDVGTQLRRTDYHRVAEGYGGVGLLLDDPSRVDEVLDEAKALSKSGKPVCINVQIAASDFRKGSISM
ncbi:MAG: thiamine pyrophosphate-binding protein [Polyangiaceae bacterium]|nr:thiamine pyrophosphate-binding protein [Polyangiaceae bacterium]MCW5790570.1 thiamine pyrophosphate-binding protein [Polyangiaceae bacterium]